MLIFYDYEYVMKGNHIVSVCDFCKRIRNYVIGKCIKFLAIPRCWLWSIRPHGKSNTQCLHNEKVSSRTFHYTIFRNSKCNWGFLKRDSFFTIITFYYSDILIFFLNSFLVNNIWITFNITKLYPRQKVPGVTEIKPSNWKMEKRGTHK